MCHLITFSTAKIRLLRHTFPNAPKLDRSLGLPMSPIESLHDHEQPPIPSQFEGNQVPHLFPFFPTYDSSPYSCSNRFHPSQVHDHSNQDLQLTYDERFPREESNDALLLLQLPATSADPRKHDQAAANQCENDSPKVESIKWMSSKMRLMRKMMNSGESSVPRKPRKSYQSSPAHDYNEYHHHQQQRSPGSSSSNSSPSGIIRVCSHCNTTKTPLWRSGPQGPKSLCNACGIRQRKARKAMAAAAMSSPTTTDQQGPASYADTPQVVISSKDEYKELQRDHAVVPFKKRCKFTSNGTPAAAHKKIGFDDFMISLSQETPLHKVFPQDETKEAAILLMALSCGLVCQ